MALCKSILVGNVVREFEVKQSKSGTDYAQFVLGCNVGYGEKAYANYFTLLAYGKTAQALGKYVTKGTKIIAECEPRQQRWQDKDGKQCSREVHIVNNWWFAESRHAQQAVEQQQQQPAATQPVSQPQQQANAKPWDSMPDFDIPFV